MRSSIKRLGRSPAPSHTSQRSRASSANSTVRGPAAVLDLEGSNTRGHRTYVGAECAVCEEPLEHTLRGERISQYFTCSHVAHEACINEWIRDFGIQRCPTCSAPLGIDPDHLDSIFSSGTIRTAGGKAREEPSSRYEDVPPWSRERRHERSQSDFTRGAPYRRGREEPSAHEHSSSGQDSQSQDQSTSSNTGGSSSREYQEGTMTGARRHDYDIRSMETALRSPTAASKRSIPPPHVTIKSEFPTLTRSSQQQSLTCLITVEVPPREWTAERGRPAQPVSTTRNVRREPRQALRKGATPSYGNNEMAVQKLKARVDEWHGLDKVNFGTLYLHDHVGVGKDRATWQDLECYLFSEMLICIKEKRTAPTATGKGPADSSMAKCNLKGSILIKKHLRGVQAIQEDLVLTLTLTVSELSHFHLQFKDRSKFKIWHQALLQISRNEGPNMHILESEQDISEWDEDAASPYTAEPYSSTGSSSAGASNTLSVTEYSKPRIGSSNVRMAPHLHVPLDIVVVVPTSSSTQGLKIDLLRDTLRFLVASLGERDRMALVTFGSSGGGVPLVGMTTRAWKGWPQVLRSIKPLGQKNARADVVEGANIAMDLLMQRKSSSLISSILLISDSSTTEAESVEFVVSRAEAAKVVIHSFGLGMAHKPDALVELSTRTKASYTYVKDWNSLRECIAGCLGSLQSISHQNARVRLHLPEGSPARFTKIGGAMQVIKRASGKDAEAALGDLRHGDKRDILVQLAIEPERSSEQGPQDAWESIVSGLEALGGPDSEEPRARSVEEVPLIQADLGFGDVFRDGQFSQLPRPTLLTVMMLPPQRPESMVGDPAMPIPPHPSVVQRRTELLTSDMLTRALNLVSRDQHQRAHKLLTETRSILKSLSHGSFPTAPQAQGRSGASASASSSSKGPQSPVEEKQPQARGKEPFSPQDPTNQSSGVDQAILSALDAELQSSLEFIPHPQVFGRDSRKAVLQAISIISFQLAYTFRTPIESLWAQRIPGIKRISDWEKLWRDYGTGDSLSEE